MSGLRTTIAMAIAACLALAADVSGNWRGTAETGTEIQLKLKADGPKLTGSVTLNQGAEKSISEGKVDGDRISFTMPSMYGGTTHTVKGRLEGEELEIRIESESFGSTTARLKRQ